MIPRVIITAHEFSPYRGSECGLGWNLINALSKSNEIVAFYARRNQFQTEDYELNIKRYLSENKINELPFKTIAVSQPKISIILGKINMLITSRISGIGFAPIYWLGVFFWEKKLFKEVKNYCTQNEIDIIHHLNHISFREPGFLWKLDKNYVIGPLSGFVKVPKNYTINWTLKLRLMNSLRNVSNYLLTKTTRFRKSTRTASHIFYVSPEDYTTLIQYNSNLTQVLDVACSAKESKLICTKSSSKKLKLLVVSRLDHLKNIKCIISILSNKSFTNKLELTIIGDGPEKNQLKKFSEELNLRNIHFLGSLDRSEVLNKMREHDLLVHLSIKEATSSVILEALSSSLPVLCHDAFGASTLIDESCGFKVPLKDESTTISHTVKVFNTILKNPRNLEVLRTGAYLKSLDYTWERHANSISKTYKQILKYDGTADK